MEVRDASPGYVPQVDVPVVPEGYKQTEVGVIPEDWGSQQLREDVTLLSGHHVLAQHYNSKGKGVPYLTGPADFPDGRIQNTKFTTRPSTICRTGDVLVTVKGSGVGTLVEADAEYCISRQLMAIRATQWDPRFVYYSLLQNGSKIKIASAGLIPGLSRSDILDQHLPIPQNPEEQRAIATALSDVDALLEALDRLIAKKRDIKQATMQQLLTAQTRLPGFEGEWQVKQLGELGGFLKGSGVRRNEAQSGNLPCVRYGEIYTVHHDLIREFQSWVSRDVAATAVRIQKGDLLFAGSGETKDEIGKCVAVVTDKEAYAGGDIVILRASKANPFFMGYALNQPAVNLQKSSFGQGDAVVHISATALSQIVIKLPLEAEQNAIAAVLSDMDVELEALKQRRAKTAALKQAMMQELLTGRTRLVERTREEAFHG